MKFNSRVLFSMATRLSGADPMANVRKMLNSLITTLETESSEAVSVGEKGWSFWNSINHGFGARLELESWGCSYLIRCCFVFLLTLFQWFKCFSWSREFPPLPTKFQKPSRMQPQNRRVPGRRCNIEIGVKRRCPAMRRHVRSAPPVSISSPHRPGVWCLFGAGIKIVGYQKSKFEIEWVKEKVVKVVKVLKHAYKCQK